jgi:hypothetical protein
MKSEFAAAGIEALAKRASEPGALVKGDFDAIVVAPSWDSRCLAITQATEVRASLGICALFENRGQLGLRDEHDPRVLKWIGERTTETVEVRGPSENLRDIWGGMMVPLLGLMRARNRPLRLLVDLSTCPRYYAAGLLSAGLQRGIVSSITFFYAEADYPEPSTEPERVEQFTRGKWQSVPVPDRMGLYNPTKRRFYFVSVGFEGAKTFTAVNRADPDRVALLFPRPGFRPEYEARCEEQCNQLLEEYQIATDLVIEAPAGDAVAAWQALTERNVEAPKEENLFYLCSGTKPHTLALTLRAYALGSPAVLYNRPTMHIETKTSASGIYWIYKISDRTAAS